jgi:hypothetical protein
MWCAGTTPINPLPLAEALQRDSLSLGRSLDRPGPTFPLFDFGEITEVSAFYWTAWAPDIVNPGLEAQGSASV